MALSDDELRQSIERINANQQTIIQALIVMTGCELHDVKCLNEFKTHLDRVNKLSDSLAEAGASMVRWIVRVLVMLCVALAASAMHVVDTWTAFVKLLHG